MRMHATLWFAASLALPGCVSADGAGDKWQNWVADHDSCEVADDCVVIYPGCPLGCFTAVSAEHEQAAIDKAEQLVSSYERAGRSCAYDCIQEGPVSCTDGTCTIGERVDTGL